MKTDWMNAVRLALPETEFFVDGKIRANRLRRASKTRKSKIRCNRMYVNSLRYQKQKVITFRAPYESPKSFTTDDE